jgi:hypothetical protein
VTRGSIETQRLRDLATDQPCGIRDCAFRDPAGSVIRINQQR